jgi:ubiquinone/menaquinone biosynthesis C-methylase UbiE
MMRERSLALSKKAEKIIMDRIKDRLIDLVLRVDNYEDLAKIAREKFNYFYENLVFSSLDLGVSEGRALDMGTQFGLCSIALAKQDYDFEITSLQDTAKFADVSRKFAEEDLVEDKIKWVTGKQESLPFEDRTFDLVISGFDMHHWENPVKVLNEIERVMKIKGALIIGDLRRDAFNVMMPVLKTISYAVKNDKIYEEMKSSFTSSYTKSEVIELLKNSDLKDYKVSKDVQFVYIRKGRKKKGHVVVKFAST